MQSHRIAVCASALVLLALTGPVAAHETPDEARLHTIHVGGRARIEVAPDRVTFRAGVETGGTEVAAAVEENNTKLRAVIESLVKQGVDRRRIRTASLSIQPQYEQVQGRRPRIIGYLVDNSIVVRVDEIEAVGKLLQTAVDAGANEVGNLSYSVSDGEIARARTAGLESALDDAKNKARILAGRAGRALGPVLILVETDVPVWPQQPMFARTMEADVSAVPTEPGLEQLTFAVSAVFGLE